MKIRLAILDMYDGTENLGMAGIVNLVEASGVDSYDVFDVRAKAEVPGLSYDIYILTGGPGDPRVREESWKDKFGGLLDEIWAYNLKNPKNQKHVLAICHSFQMVCDHFKLGEITKRRKQSFGVFPVHKTAHGEAEELFEPLPDPFYIADFRFYQVVSPDEQAMDAMGAKVLLKEKLRPHVPLERAVMGIRFSDTWLGVQFHPEAHAAGMVEHFYKKSVKPKVLELKGEEKFSQMIEDLGDPDKLELTHDTIIPGFLKNAIEKVQISREALMINSASH